MAYQQGTECSYKEVDHERMRGYIGRMARQSGVAVHFEESECRKHCSDVCFFFRDASTCIHVKVLYLTRAGRRGALVGGEGEQTDEKEGRGA